MRDNIVDYNVMHNMTSRIMNSIQYLKKKKATSICIIFHIFSLFFIYSLSLFYLRCSLLGTVIL